MTAFPKHCLEVPNSATVLAFVAIVLFLEEEKPLSCLCNCLASLLALLLASFFLSKVWLLLIPLEVFLPCG